MISFLGRRGRVRPCSILYQPGPDMARKDDVIATIGNFKTIRPDGSHRTGAFHRLLAGHPLVPQENAGMIGLEGIAGAGPEIDVRIEVENAIGQIIAS